MTDPRRRTVLVTGGAQRIGRCLVEHLAARGWAVAIHYNHSAKPAEELAARLNAGGGRAVALGADLSSPTASRALAEEAAKALGSLTAVVNNASRFVEDSAGSATPESWDAHLTANLQGPAFLAQGFAAVTKPEDDPVLVNILDQKVGNLNPDFFSYTVSKLGLLGLTRLLAVTWAGRIRVHGIAPGLTLPSADQTAEEFARTHRMNPLGRGSDPEDLARAVSYLLDTPSARAELLYVDGGQHLEPRARDVMFEIRQNPEE